MKRFAVLLFFVQQLIFKATAEGFYSVIAPGTLQSHSDYTVAIAVDGLDEPTDFTVGIVGPSLNSTKRIHFAHKSELLTHKFLLPDLEKGNYNLTIRGEGSLNFFNTTSLNHEKRKSNIFIQTDKGIYKPGEVLRFRVIILDLNLRPFYLEDLESQASILIEDSNGNRVKQFRQLNIRQGVFTGSFEIPSRPAIGRWRIIVKLYEHLYFGNKIANFEVIEYEMPEFEVRLTVNNRVSVIDGKVVADVTARYNYDKLVYNGKTTIIAELQRKDLYENAPIVIETVDLINGKSKIKFSVAKFKKIIKSNAEVLKVTAIVAEDYTDAKVNASATVTLMPTRYFFLCKSSETCNTFTAKKASRVEYEILRVDGNSPDIKTDVLLIYTENDDKNHSYEFHGKWSTKENHVTFIVEDLKDLNRGNYYDADIVFDDEEQRVDRVYPKNKYPTMTYSAKTQTGNYFHIKMIGIVTPHHFATALINSSRPLKYFNYVIMGNEDILEAEHVTLDGNTKIKEIRFNVTLAMVPAAKIYVHYFYNGYYYYSELVFNVKFEFQNLIDINVPQEVRIGSQVHIKVRTLPNSFVGLTAVDQTVSQNNNNNFTKNDLKSNLAQFTSVTPPQPIRPYPGEKCGMVTLTNGHYYFVYKNQRRQAKVSLQTRSRNKKQKPIVREHFTDTWIFEDIENTETGSIDINRRVPDSITSWVITGFSINKEKGIAMSYPPHDIRAFQPFFITLRLPYYVRRHEKFAVTALVFNYLPTELLVNITLYNEDKEFVFVTHFDESKTNSQMSLEVLIPSNSTNAATFWIKPLELGSLLLKVKATSALAGDTLIKSIDVIPEGLTEYHSKGLLVNVKTNKKQYDSLTVALPKNKKSYIRDSVHATLFVGDFMGPMLNGLIHYTDTETATGENAISLFVTNVQMIRYLSDIKNLSARKMSKLIENLKINYKRIQLSLRPDGGFNSYNQEKSSTWLTAFVIRYLIQARTFIDIKDTIIENGISFIESKYEGDGKFAEDGEVIYSKQTKDIWITANIVLALLDYGVLNNDMLRQGLKFLYSQIHETDDSLARVIAMYALHKSGDINYDISAEFINLNSQAVTVGDQMWWESEKNFTDIHWVLRSKDLNVALTSYILLIRLRQFSAPFVNNFNIAKYLIGQRNLDGRFADDFETTVATEALIEFARQVRYTDTAKDLVINVTTKGSGENLNKTFKIDFENDLEFQNIELPEGTRQVDFEATGKGTVLIQVNYQFNVMDNSESSSIDVDVGKIEHSINRMKMKICIENTDEESSTKDLIVMEVALPSGFKADTLAFAAIRAVASVKHVDSIDQNSVIRIFFYKLKIYQRRCVTIKSIKVYDVTETMPVSVIAYDYYDRSKKTIKFYNDYLNLEE